jgi:DUF4097 and DUF4098 domain-containing protein YvlB
MNRFSSITSNNDYITYDIKQGGTLDINFSQSLLSNITITSGWRDHVEIENCNVKVVHDKVNNTLIITNNDKGIVNDMNIRIPEVFNLELQTDNANVNLRNKIHGDVAIKLNSGNISLDKVRGSNINLLAGQGNVTITKLLEGNIKLDANKLKAKMVNGDIIELSVIDNIDIEAMYAKKSFLKAINDTNIGIIHGQTKVICQSGNVTIGGLDGSFDILANEGNINLQLNKVKLNSGALANKGRISVSVDPEIVTDVYLKSLTSNVSIISDAVDFQPLSPNNNNAIIEGRLTGKSRSPKRPIFNRGTSLSGKINLEGADSQSMQTIMNDDDSLITLSKIDSSMKFVASGDIKLETLSWIEAIRRRHGLSNTEGTIPPKTVGRTASAKLRVAEIVKESDI